MLRCMRTKKDLTICGKNLVEGEILIATDVNDDDVNITRHVDGKEFVMSSKLFVTIILNRDINFL